MSGRSLSKRATNYTVNNPFFSEIKRGVETSTPRPTGKFEGSNCKGRMKKICSARNGSAASRRHGEIIFILAARYPCGREGQSPLVAVEFSVIPWKRYLGESPIPKARPTLCSTFCSTAISLWSVKACSAFVARPTS